MNNVSLTVLVLQVLPHEYFFSCLYKLLSALFLKRISFGIFSQTCIFHYSLVAFPNLWCSNYGKMHLWVNKLKVDIVSGNRGGRGCLWRFHEAKNRFHSSKYAEFPRSYLHFFRFEVLSLLWRYIEIKNLSFLIHKTLVEFGWTHLLQRIFLRSSLWYHIAFSLL